MPSNIAHNYFAKCVLNKLSEEICDCIDNNMTAYLMGSQGPDLLFYLRYEDKPLPKLGALVHISSKTYEIFKDSANYAISNNPKIMLPFLMGQLCHYAMDSNLHAYIYHRELDLPQYYSKDAHKYIHVVYESGLDLIVLKDYLKVNPYFYKSYKNINCDKITRQEIGTYYSQVVAPMFNMQLTPETGDKMLRLMRLFYKICDDMTGIKYLIVRAFEKLTSSSRKTSAFMRPRRVHDKEDWLNHNRTPFPKYRFEEELSKATLEEMTAKAIEDAVDLINNFYKYSLGKEDLDKHLYYRNYAGTRYDKIEDEFLKSRD